MGRLFVTSVEGPAYQCRSCERVDIAAYVAPENRIPQQFGYKASLGGIFIFHRCFNVVIGTHETTFTVNGVIDNRFREVFCIACNSHLGFYYHEGGVRYNEGNFYMERSKLHGPPDGSGDDDGNEEEVDVIYGSDDEDRPGNGSDDEDDNPGNEEDVDVIGE